ncbi:hypothetical protein FHS20_004767 [Phyllobacterium endophyticum]|uniref:DUF2147 domain-containing protein n=1 Tax=Phyllobacterium endophyticum TaxID=1149773 RepID=A0A2P7B1F1_9HYPH|nr:hypothetical protein [Phyllobacterium endophyticum]PSH60299.1 hypothetical protein CU100_06320 [Phyllobacterium endophyticum]
MVRYLLMSFAYIALQTGPAHAGGTSFEGTWHQIASNAGACRTCAVEFKFAGTLLSVNANNGWKATAQNVSESSRSASANGHWSKDAGHLAASPFRAFFEIVDSRLFMKMLVRKKDGSVMAIKAIFERPSQPTA